MDESHESWRKAVYFKGIIYIKSIASSRQWSTHTEGLVWPWHNRNNLLKILPLHSHRQRLFCCMCDHELKVWDSYRWINFIWAVKHENTAVTEKIKNHVWSANTFWLQCGLSLCKWRWGTTSVTPIVDLYNHVTGLS